MSIPLYGSNKAGNALNGHVKNAGYKEISTVTAGDSSHTLSADDGGVIFITAALASAAVIKLPEATEENIGLEYNILIAGVLAAAAKISLPNAKNSVFAGLITQERSGTGAGVADAADVNRTTVVTKISDGEKTMELDENDVTFGGAVGTNLSFKYVAKDVVFVSGTTCVNVASTALDALQSTTFTGTGY